MRKIRKLGREYLTNCDNQLIEIAMWYVPFFELKCWVIISKLCHYTCGSHLLPPALQESIATTTDTLLTRTNQLLSFVVSHTLACLWTKLRHVIVGLLIIKSASRWSCVICNILEPHNIVGPPPHQSSVSSDAETQIWPSSGWSWFPISALFVIRVGYFVAFLLLLLFLPLWNCCCHAIINVPLRIASNALLFTLRTHKQKWTFLVRLWPIAVDFGRCCRSPAAGGTDI